MMSQTPSSSRAKFAIHQGVEEKELSIYSIIATATPTAAINPNELLDPSFPAAPTAIGEPVGGKLVEPVPVPVGMIDIEGAVPDGTGTIITDPVVGKGTELVGATGVDG